MQTYVEVLVRVVSSQAVGSATGLIPGGHFLSVSLARGDTNKATLARQSQLLNERLIYELRDNLR